MTVIHDTCHCGSDIRIDDPTELWTTEAISEQLFWWRTQHRHEPAVQAGRCTARARLIRGAPIPWCELTEGHTGAHMDGTCAWTDEALTHQADEHTDDPAGIQWLRCNACGMHERSERAGLGCRVLIRGDVCTGLLIPAPDPTIKAEGDDAATDIKDLIGRERCCDKDMGGSHYHCARCGGVSSMQGHSIAIHRVADKKNPGFTKNQKVDFHFHCPPPLGCELEDATTKETS